jgi:hypothetical protein
MSDPSMPTAQVSPPWPTAAPVGRQPTVPGSIRPTATVPSTDGWPSDPVRQLRKSHLGSPEVPSVRERRCHSPSLPYERAPRPRSLTGSSTQLLFFQGDNQASGSRAQSGKCNIEFSCRAESADHATALRTKFLVNRLRLGGQLQRFVMSTLLSPEPSRGATLSSASVFPFPVPSQAPYLGHG